MGRKRLDEDVNPAEVKSFVFGDGEASEEAKSQPKPIAKTSKQSSKRGKGKGIMAKLAKPEKEATKRFNADIPITLHKRLATFCVSNDLSMTEFAIAAIEQALDEAED